MESSVSYLLWVIIIIIVSFGFDFYKEKKYSTGKIFSFVLLPTWIFIGLIYAFLSDSFKSLETLAGSLAFVLPMTLIFGGGTFVYKYYKSKKKIS